MLVVGFTGKKKGNHHLWFCKCDCGGSVEAMGVSLRAEERKSCGCLHKESLKGLVKHGHCLKGNTPEFNSWVGMKQRCYNQNNPSWKHYGGRGITVCESWLESFNNFLSDMGEKPSPKHSVGRIDNDQPYSPWNCRWETSKQQGRNKRKTFLVTVGNQSKTAQEWEETTGIKSFTIKKRLKRGWSPIKALTEPVK